jgi:hypothetical protein
MAPLFTGLKFGFGRSAGEGAATPSQQYYFSSSDLSVTLTQSEANSAKVVIVAGTGSNGSPGGNAAAPASGATSGGAGGQSNVAAYINVPFNSLATGRTLNVKANYSDPFYSSAVQFQTSGTTGDGRSLAMSNSNGTPYSNTSDAITALNSFTSVYSFGAGDGGPTQSSRGASNGYAGGVGGGGAGGLVISLNSSPYPSDITTPLPPASVNANPGNIGGDLYKDPGSYANGGSGGVGGSGVGAGGGGGGGGGGTGWNDWPAPIGARDGGGGGTGSPQRVFVAIIVRV